MKKIICLLKEHKWSQWYNWGRGDKQYRYCERCGKQQFRIGLMMVKARGLVKRRLK